MGRVMFGRKKIFTDVRTVTPDNVYHILQKAMAVHVRNRDEIEYLYDVYCGKQDILDRKKKYRPEVCNKIVENHANEIVTFKVGYLMFEPVQYVNRGDDKADAEAINTLTDYMFLEGKAKKDKELADWMHICGTAFRLALPDPNAPEDEAPFNLYTLDPRNTFVVYWSGLGNPPVLGVRYVKLENGSMVFTAYSDRWKFDITISRDFISPLPPAMPPETKIRAERHLYGDVPIVEYPANEARLGAFEIVLPLLDAINQVESNRLDGVEQFIDALLVLKGVDLKSEEYEALKAKGGLKLPADGDAYYIAQELNQTQTQTLIDDMYQQVLVICGMPNRNGSKSTSDTGKAVIMRDGWSDAEARAKNTEDMFKAAERLFLRIVLGYAEKSRDFKLRASRIDVRLPRRNYENVQTKAQVLATMLSNDKIAPHLAYLHCGLFVDPEQAYKESMEYYDQVKAEEQQALKDFAENETAKAKAKAEAEAETESGKAAP